LEDFTWGLLINPNHWPGALVLAVLVFGGAWLVSRGMSRIMLRSKWIMGKLGRRVDDIVIRYAVQIKTLVLFLAAGVLYASLIPALRTLLNTILAGAGITALVMGLAARSTLSNLVAGLSLAIYRPIRIGDKLTIENEYGAVEDITLRHTIVRTWENKRLVIPNEKLDNMSLVNHSIVESSIMCRVEVGVSYDTSIDLAREIMLQAARDCPHGMPEDQAPAPPTVRVVELANFSIVLRIYLWTVSMDEAWLARFWILEQVKKRFDAQGVEIPFPYRTLVYKKDMPPARTYQPPPNKEPENSS